MRINPQLYIIPVTTSIAIAITVTLATLAIIIIIVIILVTAPTTTVTIHPITTLIMPISPSPTTTTAAKIQSIGFLAANPTIIIRIITIIVINLNLITINILLHSNQLDPTTTTITITQTTLKAVEVIRLIDLRMWNRNIKMAIITIAPTTITLPTAIKITIKITVVVSLTVATVAIGNQHPPIKDTTLMQIQLQLHQLLLLHLCNKYTLMFILSHHLQTTTTITTTARMRVIRTIGIQIREIPAIEIPTIVIQILLEAAIEVTTAAVNPTTIIFTVATGQTIRLPMILLSLI